MTPRPSPAHVPLVLASASPRRRSLLQRVGLEVTVCPVHVDESVHDEETAAEAAERLAADKANAAAQRDASQPILAADTIVSIDGELLGKPADRSDAVAMLRRLSGRWHEVVTGVALWTPTHGVATASARTRVRFADLAREEIERYADSTEPYDKAGAYAIQGSASWFVETITGSSSNVVGLPLEQVRILMAHAGLPLPTLGSARLSGMSHLVAGEDDPI